MKKHQPSLVDARKALALNPNLFEAHYLIGVILDRKKVSNVQGMTEQALDAFIAASRINDQNPGRWLRMKDAKRLSKLEVAIGVVGSTCSGNST